MQVYKGSLFGTPVCVKVVPMDHHNPDDIKQVQREIAALKYVDYNHFHFHFHHSIVLIYFFAYRTLNHPNLVQFFGLFSLNNEMYIVTEYIPGTTPIIFFLSALCPTFCFSPSSLPSILSSSILFHPSPRPLSLPPLPLSRFSLTFFAGGTVRKNIEKDKGEISWATRVKVIREEGTNKKK